MWRKLTTATTLVAVALVSSQSWAEPTEVVITIKKGESGKPPFKGKRAAVDVAILLDTSSSMNGLINQAKSQLWTIVQQFAKAKKHNRTPLLRVALFEYGNNGLPASEGYIRQVVPLTDDLDKLSEALFSLTTNGGDEYCGQVIDQALTRLDWSGEPDSYKAIFIAGNEPFTQGDVDYRNSCKRAIEMGIVVNTIHCGSRQAGVQGQWRAGASLAEGEFFNINQDRKVLQIDCPQDEIILRLNTELNQTYLWYGSRASRGRFAENQRRQDANAESLGRGIGSSRAIAKSSGAYQNSRRCLVDSYEQNADILSIVKEEHLPDALQALPVDKREGYVRDKLSERKALRSKIKEVAKQRESYLAKERKRLAQEGQEDTLGAAVVAAVAKQLATSGFETEADF